MAEKDLQKFFEFQKKADPIIKALKEVFKVCDGVLDSDKDLWWSLNNVRREAENELKKLEKELNDLKKYSLCQHSEGDSRWVGNDSHKDHYETKCVLCGKVLKTDYV